MNYEEFKKRAHEEILSYMPEKYRDYRVELRTVTRANEVLDGLVFIPGTESGEVISPVVYVNQLYDLYLEDGKSLGTFEETMKKAVEWIAKDFESADFDVDAIMKNAEEKLFFFLVNTEESKDFLADKPHREFLDLSVCYGIWVELKDRMGKIVIDNALAEKLALDEERLYEIAFKNTKYLLEIKVDRFMGFMPIASGKRNFWADGAMLYGELLKEVSEDLGGDFYIIPSSVHELLFMEKEDIPVEGVAKMIKEVNRDVLKTQDFLSDTVYLYDSKNEKVVIAA